MSNIDNISVNYYKVGGAVRDALLGLEVKDTDWLVVGATPEYMVKKGFKPVGQQFPVFLHPETHEEYALARTERKAGRGYHGFEFFTSADVTIEQDLTRRDLTINAIAMDTNGTIIDPHHGQQDLKQKRLRHVSAAFNEDPLRVLRVARFYSRFANLGFEIDKSTISLMQQLVNNNELSYLSAERIWSETYQALQSKQPWRYFQALQQCGALSAIDVVLANNADHIIQILQLELLAQLGDDYHACYAAILTWCFRLEHSTLKSFCLRHKLPNQVFDIAQKAIQALPTYMQMTESTETEQKAQQLFALIKVIGGWRHSSVEEHEKLMKIINICSLVHCYLVKKGQKKSSVINHDLIFNALKLTAKINSKPFIDEGLQGAEIAKAIDAKRLELIQQLLNETT